EIVNCADKFFRKINFLSQTRTALIFRIPLNMADKPQLIRGLNLRDTTALVVGTIIGTGVFLKTAKMAQAVGSPGLVLLAWVAAGILSLAGALAYAELGAMMPQAGGKYVYLKRANGELQAFLFGWMRIV